MVSEYERFLALSKQYWALETTQDFLGADANTQMPEAGSAGRAMQIESVIVAQKKILFSPEMHDLLSSLSQQNLNPEQEANVREMQRLYINEVAAGAELLGAIEGAAAAAHPVWRRARAENNFGLFLPSLRELVNLTRQKAAAIDPAADPYEVLMRKFDPDADYANLVQVLRGLQAEMTPLLHQIMNKSMPDMSFVGKEYPAEHQKRLALEAIQLIGFDLSRGRFDITTHPFTTGVNPGDVIITTRYLPETPLPSFFAALHEAGHGTYEQGLPMEWLYQPIGYMRSLGVHESQSRFWENFVGRSRAFWEVFFPNIQNIFSQQLNGYELEKWYKAVNKAEPSFIRVEADEVTYNLHILVRVELEHALINGEIELEDLPEAWNRKMQDYLGITPQTDTQGVLQDVHWSKGNFGYFGTYSQGNILAAQLVDAMGGRKALDDMIKAREFPEILGWMREKIHSKGSFYTQTQLLENIVGPLNSEPFVRQMREKYSELYNL